MVTLLITSTNLTAGAESDSWPDGCRFRVAVEPKEPAGSYELMLAHHGLARPDARDVRVVSGSGEPVSSFVSFADRRVARILWDGQTGPGVYHVYFGNWDTDLPALPADGRVAAGRADWRPAGGFECTTYKADQPQQKFAEQLRDMASVLEFLKSVRQQAEARQAELDQLPAEERAKRVPFVIRNVYPHTAGPLPADPGETGPGPDGNPVRVDNRFVHVLRMKINLPAAATYQFVVSDGNALKVLVVDGDTSTAVIRGWYEFGWGSWNVNQRVGDVSLAAGEHLLELYTFLSAPDLKMRVGEGQPAIESVDGRYARFDSTVLVPAGPLAGRSGRLADDCLTVLELLRDRKEFTAARVAARALRSLFPGDPEVLGRLDAVSEAALQSMNQNLWTMEGKYPSRTGAVVDAPYFAPPFKVGRQIFPRTFHDWGGLSSPVWTENGLHYGLDFEVVRDAWCITSGAAYQDGILYLGMKNGKMFAIDLARQAARWGFPGEGPCYGSPLCYRGVLYYGSLDTRLYALDAERGRMLWNFPTRGWIEGSPAAEGDTIYFGSEDAHLYAVDAALGVERWQARLDGPIGGTPACAGGRVYIGTRAGTFYALDGRTGEVVWSYRAGASLEGGSCVGAGRIAFGDRRGFVHCLDVAAGTLAWDQPCPVGGPVTAAPILVGDVLYGGTADGSAYWGIDLAEGQLGWTLPVVDGGDVNRPALFVEDHLVFIARNRGAGKDTMRQSLVDLVMAEPAPIECWRATEPITVDGQLSEASWAAASRLPAFAKRNGMVLGDPFTVRLLWDDQAVYVGITGQNTPPSGAAQVIIFLDGVQGGQNVTQFTVPANGERAKGTGPFTAKGGASDTAWSLEVSIPATNFPGPAFSNGRPSRLNIVVGGSEVDSDAWYLVPSAALEPASLRWAPLRFAEPAEGEPKH